MEINLILLIFYKKELLMLLKKILKGFDIKILLKIIFETSFIILN